MIADIDGYDVVLFSGGLDSLAGVLEKLRIECRKVITVSHKSNNNTIHLQKELIKRLNTDYNNKILPHSFSCHNKKIVSVEETQRTRMFLFSAIAFSICQCYDKHQFYIYENGVTSLNFPVQGDVMNARASRTTHPKTLGLLKKFYNFFDDQFVFVVPYYKKTKEDIIKVFQQIQRQDLLASAVSCSSTRRNNMFQHCGCCSQCIDRRFAFFAAELTAFDCIYEEDFIHKIKDQETKQRLYQQMRFASRKDFTTANDMIIKFPTETMEAIEYWPCDNPEDSLNEIFELLSKYSDSALRAAKQMQLYYDDLRIPIEEDSFLKIIADREYLQTPFEMRIKEIDDKLSRSLPLLFNTEKPKNENDFNDKVMALLSAGNERWMREYPVISFGITSYKADGSHDGLIIESKYIRKKTSPSVAMRGIAEDITLVPAAQNMFFVVYDPERSIVDDDEFCKSLMSKKPNCVVKVYR